MADELDALLQLAEEVDGADLATFKAQGHTATTLQQPDPTEEDPLLGLADAICHDQQNDKPAPSTAAKPSRVTICSTRAFSSATPGSTNKHSSSRAAGLIAHTSGMPRPQQQQQQHHDVQHYVEKLTGLKIKLPRVSGIVLKERYRSITCVPVSKAQQHMAADGSSWVVIGVLVSKQIGTTHKGAPYSRWRVSDLAGSDTLIALFGEAHKEHYAQAEGSVLAFYTPRFSSKGPGGSSSSSGGLAVSQAAQVELLATSAGWGFCRGTTKAGARCSLAVDTTISHYCQYHALQQAKTLRAPVKAAARQQQQQAAAETPSLHAASNGRVFDARSKTWSTGSCPAPPAVAATTAVAGPGGRHSSSSNTSSRGHVGNSSSSSSSIPAGGFGSRSTSSNVALPPTTAGNSGGGMQTSSSSTAQRAKAATQQAELRESLKAKLQQQQQKQQGSQRQDVSSLDDCSKTAAAAAAAARGRRPSAGSGGGFNLTSVMAAVSGGVLPAEEQQQLQREARWCPQQQQQGQQQHTQQRQQHQQHQHLQRQQQELQQQQQPARQCGPQHNQQPKQQQPQGHQQEQQQQDGLDDLIDELFDDNDMDDEDDDALVIQPAAAAAAAGADAATSGQHTAQPGAHGSGGDGGSDGLSSAAAQAAAAMARLSGSRPPGGGNSSSGDNGALTAAKLTDARKRMKVALGLAPKSSLNGAGSSSSKQGSAGPGAGKVAGAGVSRQAAARPHVSRIGAVGGASVGAAAAAGADAGVVRSSHSVAGAGAAGAVAVAGSSAARAAAGSSSARGSSAGGGAASGFRAMFGRVLQRADINKPDAKLLGAVSDAAHASMMSKLLNQYEQKDNLAQQLEGITKLEVTAFECRTCKFLTEKRRATCSGHDIVAVRVTKRWWICEACGWKLHTLRELMPSKRCPKCRDPEKLFRPTSAYNVPKPSLVNPEAASNPIASRESMLARGHEHAFCLNSLKD